MSRAFLFLLVVLGLVVGLWVDWNARWEKPIAAREWFGRNASPAAEYPRDASLAAPRETRLRAEPEAGFVRLSGRVSRADGAAIAATELDVRALDEHAREVQALPLDESGFEFPRLAAGRWWVTIAAWGCCPTRETIDLAAGSGDARRDVTLSVASRVLVRARGAERGLERVEFVATRAALSDLVPEGAFEHAEDLVVSRASRSVRPSAAHDAGAAAAGARPRLSTTDFALDVPADAWGFLRLDRAPPLHVSAVLGAVVLATTTVDAEAREVEFDLRERRAHGSPRRAGVQVVDARTGAPIRGARVAWTDARTEVRETDGAGRAWFDGVEPGWGRLAVSEDAHGSRAVSVRVGAPVPDDLCRIELPARASFSGRVVGPHGEGLETTVACLAPGQRRDPSRREIAWRARTAPDGSFSFQDAERGPVVITLDDERWAIRPRAVDLSTGAVAADAVIAVAAARLVVLLPHASSADARLSVVDAEGHAGLDEAVRGRERIDARLAPGAWRVIVADGDRTLVERSFDLDDVGLTLDLTR